MGGRGLGAVYEHYSARSRNRACHGPPGINAEATGHRQITCYFEIEVIDEGRNTDPLHLFIY